MLGANDALEKVARTVWMHEVAAEMVTEESLRMPISKFVDVESVVSRDAHDCLYCTAPWTSTSRRTRG